jgi:OmpA-OmpF porin, OOP family
MNIRNALLAATVFAIPVAANAQVVSGPYIDAGAGLSLMNATTLTGSNNAVTGRIKTAQPGYNAFVSAGYGFGNGLRAEGELMAYGNVAKVTLGNTMTGSTTSYNLGGMINGLYDFDLGIGATPYVGLGIGYVGNQQRGFYAAQPVAANGQFYGKSAQLGSFAGQAIVGIAWPVNQHLSLTFDYRLIDNFAGRSEGGNFANGTNYSGASLKEGSMLEHTFNIGLRWAMNAPEAPMAMPMAAPVAVTPAPAPARSYLVFFDWDKADLTARAQQIIAEAAGNAAKVGSTKISVAGHADKSGTPEYNMALSLRRANNVAAELVRLGVAKSEIAITAYGDTKPLVPTAPGVREPQNRRVEIVLN